MPPFSRTILWILELKLDGLNVVYRAYECEIDEDDFPELIEELHEKSLDGGVMAVGHTLYMGYDCEWVERNGKLYVLSYQFYLICTQLSILLNRYRRGNRCGISGG